MAGVRQDSSKRNRCLSRVLYAMSLVLLGFGLVNLGWVVWPAPTGTRAFTIPAGPLSGAPSGKTYASQADYALRVSWPRRIRAGEEGEIVVSLAEVDPPEEEALARETQVVLLEPSLISLPVDPPGLAQINLGSGQELRETWTVEGAISGEYPGKLVVSFGFYDEVLGDLVPVPVAVVDLSIRVVTLWGLARGLVLWLGIVGLVLWGALFILGRMVQEGRD